MAAINKAVNITFKGETHNILINMKMIDYIEDEMNIAKFVNRLSEGDVRLSHAAKLFALILQSAGVDASQEDVYTEMFSDGAELNSVVLACSSIVSAMFPESETDTKKKPVKRAKK